MFVAVLETRFGLRKEKKKGCVIKEIVLKCLRNKMNGLFIEKTNTVIDKNLSKTKTLRNDCSYTTIHRKAYSDELNILIDATKLTLAFKSTYIQSLTSHSNCSIHSTLLEFLSH